eukprot:c29248_g1_i1 orf=2870-5629(+)
MAGCWILAAIILLALLMWTTWPGSLAGDVTGFISIGCSWVSASYSDSRTGIMWTSDTNFIQNLGRCVPLPMDTSSQIRIFPDGVKNCYTLSTLVGQQYLIRGNFYYGNYDQKSSPPVFNISIDATPVFQVFTSETIMKSYEMIVSATSYVLSYCLIKIPQGGTPLISSLEVRPLHNASYFQGSSSVILRKLQRIDNGNNLTSYRYPIDPVDRIWDRDNGADIITGKISSTDMDNFSAPGVVLETAGYATKSLDIICKPEDGAALDYYVKLYFAELNNSAEVGSRVFDIYGNGVVQQRNFDILRTTDPSREQSLVLQLPYSSVLNISLVASPWSVLPPSLNAFEVYQIVQISVGTRQEDVEALLSIKEAFQLLHWSGDPCLPLSGENDPSFWDGLTCSLAYGSATVTKLNLSFRGLTGPIPAAIHNLVNLEDLSLVNNLLVGTIPNFSALVNLTTLYLQNNKLTGIIPSKLLSNKNVDFRYANNSVSYTNDSTSNREGLTIPKASRRLVMNNRFKLLVGCFVGGSLLLLVVVIIIAYSFLYKRHAKLFSAEASKAFQSPPKYVMKAVPELEKVELKSIYMQEFSLSELHTATNSFSNRIGEGGFGAVYHGILPDGQIVAVKVRSANSIQGIREFTTELTLLSGIWHENLVPLIGYCPEQQILVYPYMSNGSLQDRLYGEAARRKPLDWMTRLNIALGAARGLNFLHSAGARCIIHRDVKSSNILLDNSMVAKVADFGFSKYAPQEGDSMVSLEVRGTAGYLDPEYYSTQQLTVKSDVFSFGVVLLEIICGREPLNIHRPRPEWSLVEWAKPFIQESNIQAIVDPTINSSYTPESMWRVVEIALSSVEPLGFHRPTMADIIRELEDALIIENNASQYMASIESLGSFRMSTEVKMPPPMPLFYQFDPSPVFSETMGSPDPR